MSGVRFFVLALAAYRVVRLATLDVISQPIRSWVAGVPEGEEIRSRTRRFFFTLLGCPWCVSIYVGAGVVAAVEFIPGRWPWLVAEALAISTVCGLIGSRDA